MPSPDDPDARRWFGVRCLFRFGDSMYEERITLWRARDFDHAIELAEEEAAQYCDGSADGDLPVQYVHLAQAYRFDDEPGAGAEVFSLIRDSDLGPDEYIDRYFDTGEEHSDSTD